MALRTLENCGEDIDSFFLEKLPLRLKLRAHFPYDIRVPVFEGLPGRLMVAIVKAPRVDLSCRDWVSCALDMVIRAGLWITPMPFLGYS